MHLSTPSTLPLLTLTLALTALAHPITLSPTQPHLPNPVAAAVAPPKDHQLQLLLTQQSDTKLLVIARPERETLGWRAEKWAEAVRWWKGAVRGSVEKDEGAWWSGGEVSAGDWGGDVGDGGRVMEVIEGDEEEDVVAGEEMECEVVDDEDEGDVGQDDGEEDDEDEDGQMEL